MSDDLILFGEGLDQSLPTEGDFTAVRGMVDRMIQEAVEAKDLGRATTLVQQLIKIAKVSGKELSRVLHTLKVNWSVFGTDEVFEDWAYRETGLHRHTIERYIRVESLLTNPAIPQEVRSELADRNLTELFPVANMMEQGFEPDADEWETILSQPDETSIRTAVREIKGQAPRPTALILTIDSRGSIWAMKDSIKKFVGSLEMEDEDHIVQQAIDRILKNTGILH